MKKYLYLCIAALALAACEKEHHDNDHDDDRDYIGTMTVTSLTDPADTRDWPAQEFEAEYERDGTITLQLDHVRFVEQMPPLDMDFPGIGYTTTPSGVLLTSERLVPRIAGRPYEQYAVTSLTGTASALRLDVEFTCMGYRVVYTGYPKHD